MKITEADATRAGVCLRMKAWFRKHGLCWETFCGEGIELDDLLATGDHEHNIRLAEKQARRRHGQG